jgi:uroporphyrin-III C-methyltransferase/precorrin-2 dehydrogenase/sirohydrochlorin ferrochelatase
VGAGPGDPDLLTRRALRLLQQADVVLYDRLVTPEILDLARRDAERIDVGKRRGGAACPQEMTNRLMVELARAGKQVVRLKAGDPLIFSRGGEELEYLSAHGIRFQVVPGVTAALGCAAYAGIPLTHRDHAQSCVFITGRGATGEPDLDWAALARPGQTVVVYMGLDALARLCSRLRSHGARPNTPVAIIENGTRPDQRVAFSTLANASDDAAAAGFAGPVLIIIGAVVGLRERLAWFTGLDGGAADARLWPKTAMAAE